MFEQLLDMNPCNSIVFASYGKALAENGNYDKACEIFERSLRSCLANRFQLKLKWLH